MNASWPAVRLRTVMEVDLDAVTVSSSENYSMVGVYSFGRGLFRKEPVSGGNTSYRTFYRLNSNHVVMSQLFGWEGALALSSEEFNGLFVSSQFPTFQCDISKLDRHFLGWLMRRPLFWKDLGTRAKGMGDRRRTLNPNSLLDAEIVLPPLSEQRRIVTRIEELASKIEEARLLREQSRKELGLVEQAYLAFEYDRLASHFHLTELGDLLVEANYGTSEKSFSERTVDMMPVLRIPNVASELVNLTDLKFGLLPTTAKGRVLVDEGDILIVRTNGSSDLVGRCAVVPMLPEPMAFASYLIRLKCDEQKVQPEFLQIMLKHLRTAGFLIDFARTTAGQYNVSLGRLRLAKVPLPPLERQRSVLQRVKALQNKVISLRDIEQQSRLELAALLPSVLDKAFRGEL